MQTLVLASPAFAADGWIPRRYTGRGEDISPALTLTGLAPEAVSLALTLDDDSHPLFPHYNHWLIWNLPVQDALPEGIPRGEVLPELGGAVQGVAYGRHVYRGPKPPRFLRGAHNYTFTAYVLDSRLPLPSSAGKEALLAAMDGHILQQATLMGRYENDTGATRG